VGLLLALVSLSPNLRAAWPDRSYFLRDFTLTYYPLRDVIVEALRQGRWPWWNPYLHEGAAFLPMFYPPELLQVLLPGPAFASWLLTLHFPLAALTAYALARELGAGRMGGLGAGIVWSTCGLAVTSLDLHWFLQALALAPAVALGLRRAARHGGRWIGAGALATAAALSTLAVEFSAQGVLLGGALGVVPPHPDSGWRRRALRALLATLAGGLVAALPVVLALGILEGSVRGAGLDPGLALQKSLHPLSLAQLVIPDLHGSIREPLRFWWGSALIPGGSPYFLSLYVGPLALALAAAGAGALPTATRGALLGLAGLGVWYALGPWGGLSPALAGLLSMFRFPVKAMLLPTLGLALMAGFGVERLARAQGIRAGALAAAGVTIVLCVVGAAMRLPWPGLAAWLDMSPRSEAMMRGTLSRECAEGLGLLLAASLAVWLAARGRLPPRQAAAALLALLGLDLWHAAVGVNRQVPAAFFDPAPGLREALQGSGRVFALAVDQSPFVRSLIEARPAFVEETSFALARQALTPYASMLDRVELAEGADRLSFIPSPSLVMPWEQAPGALPAVLGRLRNAAVTRVVSLDRLEHPELSLRARVPLQTAGAAVHVYELLGSWPRRFIACRARTSTDRAAAMRAPFAAGYDPAADVALEVAASASCSSARVLAARSLRPEHQEYDVESDGAGYLVTRDSWARGWRASVDGQEAPVLRANGRHRAVPVPPGTHRVVLSYEPPGLLPGLLLSALGLGLVALSGARR
jgi:hypothetical protein